MLDTPEKVTAFANDAILHIEMMQNQSMLVQEAARAEMVRIREAIEMNREPRRRVISFQESRFHEGLVMAGFIAKTYAKGARDSGKIEDALRALEKLEDLVDACNIERARNKRAALRAGQSTRRASPSERSPSPARAAERPNRGDSQSPDERRASGESPSSQKPEAIETAEPEPAKELLHEREALDTAAQAAPVTHGPEAPTPATPEAHFPRLEAWRDRVNEWSETGQVGPVPVYPRDVLDDFRRLTANDPELRAHTANFEAQLRFAGLHPDQHPPRSPEVSAPAGG